MNLNLQSQLLKLFFTKISFLALSILFFACNATKHLNKDESLLTENIFVIDNDTIKNPTIKNYKKPKPNSRFLGTPLRLNFYNLAKKNPDSVFTDWLNRKAKRKKRLYKTLSKKQTIRLQNSYSKLNTWLKKSGEPPALVDSVKINSSLATLKNYYRKQGWRDAEISYSVNYDSTQTAKIRYDINKGKAYLIDSITFNIKSKVVDSIYKIHEKNSYIQLNSQYKTSNLVKERDRITSILRNSGLYKFEKESISYDSSYDSIHKTYWIEHFINNKKIRGIDSTWFEPYKVFKISEVNVFTDFKYKFKGQPITDSITYKNYNFYSFEKQKYKPKALADIIFIKPGDLYKDISKAQTLTQLNNLKTFKYPNIKYEVDKRDSTSTNLIANILLTPREKFGFDFSLEALHNNVQNAGLAFSTSFLARNVFKGAENFELALRGSIGSSKDAAKQEDTFFDLREVGADLKLSFPRIFFPVNTSKFIPKTAFPTTRISIGASTQTNIGLDKTTFTGILNYRWFPNKIITSRLDLFNVQFVRNLNPDRYFNVYSNSYDRLNSIALNSTYTPTDLTIPTGTDQFISDVLNDNLTPSVDDQISDSDRQEVSNIEERRQRLTENNLIFTTNFSLIRNTRANLLDNNFSRIGAKIELAGNTLSTLAKALNLERNSNDRFELFNVEYSQYIKTELDYIKYWELSSKQTFALRSFFGIAIPYGNSNSIPFSRSFFGGGSNDNRAWEAYSLGPGSSGGVNEFNEANMKISLSTEYRQDIFGDLKGALFIDAGNIWNVLDSEEDETYTFESFKDLSEIAIGSGFGLRYDFSFFLLRFDIGFKTYEPYLNDKKWFTHYNFKNAVYNVGINYPF